jgi:hypothetical protein
VIAPPSSTPRAAHRARAAVGWTLATLVLAGAADLPVKVAGDTGKSESGYGAKFYNVVGTVENTGAKPLQYVQLKVELLDAAGKVVASMETYNESAEALTAPGVDAAALVKAGKVKPVPAGATERFRTSFLEEETPKFESHRVVVVAAPAVD